jgi:hypothetical protein
MAFYFNFSNGYEKYKSLSPQSFQRLQSGGFHGRGHSGGYADQQ